jgi:hypothetical protein
MLQPEDASLPAQPGGCARCHPGLGAKPNPIDQLTDADLANVDCLICHSPDYQRTVVKDGETFKLAPVEGLDVAAAAQSAQRPTSDMCLRCHLKAAGGPNFKHGEVPSPGYDVHMDAGIMCVDCHYTEAHKVAGGGYIIARDDIEYEVTCTNCHEEPVHPEEYAVINEHTGKVACQTCHIPLLARDPNLPTQMVRDYSQPVLNETTGLYGPKIEKQGNVVPEYHWWNGWMKTPPEPVGSLDDVDSKIFPWKPMTVVAPFDAETKEPVYIKQGVYQIKGSLDAAVAAGVEASGQEYSGAWEPHSESMLFDAQHQVAPAEESLKCADCHVPEGRVDFVALGYSDEQATKLAGLAAPEQETGEAQAEQEAGQAPAETPETGGMPLMPGWFATVLVGLAALATGVATGRLRQ